MSSVCIFACNSAKVMSTATRLGYPWLSMFYSLFRHHFEEYYQVLKLGAECDCRCYNSVTAVRIVCATDKRPDPATCRCDPRCRPKVLGDEHLAKSVM